ncbi:MAG: VOC family protein [Pseudomonadota bacterium]
MRDHAAAYTAPTGTSIGHVHLRVADLDRAIAFYAGVLGFQVQARLGDRAAFLGAPMSDGAETPYHHHIGLNTWESLGATPPPAGHTGLYHAAILYPSRTALADAVRRVLDAGLTLSGASDHGVSEAVYLNDPDGNGLELYRDRPAADWPRDGDGALVMTLDRLDVDALLRDASPVGTA